MNDKMPLLESLLPEGECAQDTVVLHINHCMDNSFYFTQKLKQTFGQVVFVAVPYNDRGVPEGLSYPAYHGRQTQSGYLLMRNNHPVEAHTGDFFSATQRMIRLSLDTEIGRQMEQGKRLLILEDGGYHYTVLRRWLNEHPSLKDMVLGGVEQTTSGIRACGAEELLYPVASVARSTYKVRIEAYFVADRVVGELKRMLHSQGNFVDFHDVLLLGYGVIGRSVAQRLTSNHVRLTVCDTDENMQQAAKQEGISLWNGVFCQEMLVLGNVGKPSFTQEMLEAFLKGGAKRIFLASASSKQVEFEAIFDALDSAQRTSLGQADSYLFPNGKEMVLLAQGFPLNFYEKSSDSLTYSMIDPVFSEMLLCARTLREHPHRLANQTYLFGMDSELGGYEAEKELLNNWMNENHLHFDIDSFNRHPQETYLQEKLWERG